MYRFGVILVELLSGQLPVSPLYFRGSDPAFRTYEISMGSRTVALTANKAYVTPTVWLS